MMHVPLALVCSVFMLESALYGVLPPLVSRYAEQFTLSPTMAGVLIGAYTAGLVLCTAGASRLVVAVGTRAVMAAGLVIVTVGSLVFGVGDDFGTLAIARVTQGVGGGLAWSSALVLLNATASERDRGRLLGVALGWASAGVMLGPVLGAISLTVGIGPVFFGLAVASSLLAFSTTRCPRPGNLPGWQSSVRRHFNPTLLLPVWVLAVLLLPFGLLNTILPLRMPSGVSRQIIAVAFVAAAGVAVGAGAATGWCADRYGRLPVIIVALTIETFLLALVPFTSSAAVALGLYAVFFGIVSSMAFVSAVALVSDASMLLGDRWGAPALILAISAYAETIGSVGGGALAASTSIALPCVLCIVFNLATLGFLGFHRRGFPGRSSASIRQKS